MLNLYYMRANYDREKFIYEKIKDLGREQKVIVLVPDQFTLEAERKAFEVMQIGGLMNVEIMSFSRLGEKILSQTGGMTHTVIDETGKTMLLRKIITGCRENLKIYSAIYNRQDFVQMVTSLIGEMKQFHVTPASLKQFLSQNGEEIHNLMLHQKLEDVQYIFEKYEETMEGTYLDVEDYLSLLAEKAGQATFLKDTVLWIDGFDFYTKKTYHILSNFLMICPDMNITFNLDLESDRDESLFEMSGRMVSSFKQMAEEAGVRWKIEKVPDVYRKEMIPESLHLESNLYAYPFEKYPGNPENLDIYICSDYYAEAETLAERILVLIRKRGWRFRDISVICNDLEIRGSIIQRVFEKNEIPYFMDHKRNILHNPLVQFILALPEVVSMGFRYEEVFRLVNTSLLDISQEEKEKLENYVLKFGIRGSLWKREFERWDEREPEKEESLKSLNGTRLKIVALLQDYEELMQGAENGKQLTIALHHFLLEKTDLAEKTSELVEDLKMEEDYEHAREVAGVWNAVISVFDQMIELTELLDLDQKTYFEMLTAGLETIEVGLIPTTIDQVLVGNLQRTKTGTTKAVFLVGVNDGVLPAKGLEAEIFHDGEKKKMEQLGLQVGRNEQMRQQEEQLAIYKLLSKPTDYLYLSYASFDQEGGEMKPSLLIDRMKKLFPLLAEKKSLLVGEGDDHGAGFKSIFNWRLKRKKGKKQLETIQLALQFENDKKYLDKEAFMKLYPGSELVISPTGLESFSRCPFSYFVKYGLKANERRIFQIAAPEMGSMFHEVLMRYSRKVNDHRIWNDISKRRCSEMIEEIILETAGEFQGGILFENEQGKYRLARMKKVCEETAWMVTSHVNQGLFNRFYFEAGFGRQAFFPPLELTGKEGKRLYLEGRIDRIDIMETMDKQYIKVIDYKSGNDKIDEAEIRSGYRLQLMLYMLAAQNGMMYQEINKVIEPAGVFYFKIKEPFVDGEKIPKKIDSLEEYIEREKEKVFRMDGVVVNEPEVIAGFDQDFSGYSQVIKVRKNKDGQVKGNSRFSALSKGEFNELADHIKGMTQKLGYDFSEGKIAVEPKKINGQTNACTYCSYRTICLFDRACAGFRFVR